MLTAFMEEKNILWGELVGGLLIVGCSIALVLTLWGQIEQLPYFALPRYVEFRQELPRSPVGRVLKRTLRDEGVTPTTWDAEAAGVTYEKR